MIHQPKLVGDIWFNSKNLGPADLAGKVVLYDFWTYSCLNCQRTLSYLRRWWQKYRDKGFVLIGIHTPEFEFEKDPKNVSAAIQDLRVEWPVVLDNDYVNWNNFANHYWPAKYLADATGAIVYSHFGEGGYGETEQEIQKLIKKNLPAVSLPPVAADEHSHGGVCFIPTPETYCGYGRGRLANERMYHYDREANYVPPEKIPEDAMALGGRFIARPEYVESAEAGATIFLRFRATEVNLVMHPVGERAVAKVSLDGRAPGEEIRGRDLTSQGEVSIAKPKLYNLLQASAVLEGVLGVRAAEGQFRGYAFTFSGCTP